MRAHVRELTLNRVLVRQNTGTHGHSLQQLHDHQVILSRVTPSRIANAPAIDEGRPSRLVKKLGFVGCFLLTLESYAEKAGRTEFLHEFGGGDGEVEKEEREAAWVVLEGEGDAGFAVAEEGAGCAGGAVDVTVRGGGGAAVERAV